MPGWSAKKVRNLALLAAPLLALASTSCQGPGSEFDFLPFPGLYVRQADLKKTLPAGIDSTIVSMRALRAGTKVFLAARVGSSGNQVMVILDEDLNIQSMQSAVNWPAATANSPGFPKGNDWTISGLISSATYGQIFAVLNNDAGFGGPFSVNNSNSQGATAITSNFSAVPLSTLTGFSSYYYAAGRDMVAMTITGAVGTTSITINQSSTLQGGNPFGSGPSGGGASFTNNLATWGYVDNNGKAQNSVVPSSGFTIAPTIECGYTDSSKKSAYPSPDLAIFAAPLSPPGYQAAPVFWIAKSGAPDAATALSLLSTIPASYGAMDLQIDLSSDYVVHDAKNYFYLIKVEREGFVVPYPSGRDRYVNLSGQTTKIFDTRSSHGGSSNPPRAYVSGYDYWFAYNTNAGIVYKLGAWWL